MKRHLSNCLVTLLIFRKLRTLSVFGNNRFDVVFYGQLSTYYFSHVLFNLGGYAKSLHLRGS